MDSSKNWNYEVSLKELQTVDVPVGKAITSRLATLDEEHGQVLGLVSSSYKLIQNKTLYDVMEEVGKDLDLKMQTIEVVKNRRATIFKYGFGDKHDKVIDLSSEANDKVKFGIEVFNSFDSVLGSGCVRFFANRLACLNGMTISKDIGKISFSSLGDRWGSNSLKEGIQSRITSVLDTAKVWNRWAQITPNRTKVGEFICGNLGKEAAKNMLEKFDTSKDKTVWGLYNILTWYITHEVRTEDPNNLRIRQWGLERVADKFYEEDFS
jgi:hypothetical protein